MVESVWVGKVVAISDGDTATVLNSDNVEVKIRLNGIDTPESEQAFGTKSTDQDVWVAKRVAIVTHGNDAKFEQNLELREFLESTKGTILVEAAGRDVIWGIGLGKNNEKSQTPVSWRGRNLLGFVLTDVRERVK